MLGCLLLHACHAVLCNWMEVSKCCMKIDQVRAVEDKHTHLEGVTLSDIASPADNCPISVLH